MTEPEAKNPTEDQVATAAQRAIDDRLMRAEQRLDQAMNQLQEARATVRGIRYLLAEREPTQ